MNSSQYAVVVLSVSALAYSLNISFTFYFLFCDNKYGDLSDEGPHCVLTSAK